MDRFFRCHSGSRMPHDAIPLQWGATFAPTVHTRPLPHGLHRPASRAEAAFLRTSSGKTSGRLPSSRTLDGRSRGRFSSSNRCQSRTARLIAAGEDKVEILPVRHFVLIDSKCRDIHGMRFVLIVPAKGFLGAAKAERRNTGRDFIIRGISGAVSRFFEPVCRTFLSSGN